MKKRQDMKERQGFTLVELLVVIAVIAMLMSILLPVLRKAKDQAMQATCANNIHQQLVGFIMYADAHDQKVFGSTGWLDGTWRENFRELMIAMGMHTEGGAWSGGVPISVPDIPAPDVFYCPSNTSRRGDRRQCYWDFDACNPNSGRQVWRIIAYLWILENDNNTQKEDVWGEDNKRWVTRLDLKNASDAELVTDVAYSDAYTGHFDIITVGGSGGGGPGMAESSSHIKNSESLFGSNIGFCDGHVSWRTFSKMEERYRWGGRNGSGPINWW